jgi:branched-chain amino acid transport system permease protein
MKKSILQICLWGIFVAFILVVVPLLFPRYQIALITEVVIFSLFAVSYNLLLGYAGLLSFGHALFFGTGAYATALALTHIPGIPILASILVAVGVTVVIGFLIGSLLLRHKGPYFALLTMAFNALFFAIATKWHSLTGGDDGISVFRPNLDIGITTFNMTDITVFYYFTMIIICPLILFCWYFTGTAMGRTVLLMRENEERMKFLGYNTNISRLILFTFTGALAGIAGSFYALFFQFTSTTAISMDTGSTVVLMTFVGGTGTFGGPILGALVYTYLQNFLSDITDRWPMIMGLIFVIMVLYVPSGLSGMILSLKERFGEGNSVKKELEKEGLD